MKSMRGAKVEELIVYEELIGEGIKSDPCRILLVIRRKDGTFVAERDEWQESQGEKERKE